MTDSTSAPLVGILQLLGLGPCLLLMAILLLTLKEPRKAILPLLFLCSLSAGFLQPVLKLLQQPGPEGWGAWLMAGESLLPAAAFLLIIQFLRGDLPRFTYWLILLLPLSGGFCAYAVMAWSGGELCLRTGSGNELQCFDPKIILSLYHIVTGALILLLLMPELSSSASLRPGTERYQQDRFWLIVGLVLLATALLATNLFGISGGIGEASRLMADTALRLAFVFIMFASFFRVFDNQFALAIERIPNAQRLLNSGHIQLGEQIAQLLVKDRRYREMGLTRSKLAEELGVSDSHLSHIVNRYFGCNFNQLLNRHRIEEAQQRLAAEPETSVTVIAFEVGFNSIPSFNRVFKATTGYSPSEWRKRAQ